MQLVYNGLTLSILHIGPFKRQAVLSATQYLYTRFTFTVTAIYNPAGNSGMIGAGGRLVPLTGRLALQTDVAIRHTLMQPRKQLILRIGLLAVLQSPLPGYTMDANNGPTPLECEVVEVAGNKTFIVTLTMQTDLNERDLIAPGGLTTFRDPSPLLSHEWSMKSGLDESFFETRTITGKCIFRRDRIDQLKHLADDYRWQLLGHPCLEGFKRVGVEVEVAPNGIEVNYVIVDREQANHIITQNVTKVEAVLSRRKAFIGWIPAGIHTVQESLKGVEEWHRETARAPGAAGVAAAGLFKIARAARVAFESAQSKLPQYGGVLNIKAWGNNQSKREDLEKACIACSIAIIPSVVQEALGYDQQITHDLMGKYVELNLVLRFGATAGIGSLVPALKAALFQVPDDDHLPIFTSPNPNFNKLVGPTPPKDGGTRGTNLRVIMANVLADTGPTPPLPALPRLVQRDRT